MGCTNDSAVYTSFIQHRIVQTYLESTIKCTIQKNTKRLLHMPRCLPWRERQRLYSLLQCRQEDVLSEYSVPASSLQLSRRKQGAPRLPVKAEVGAGPFYVSRLSDQRLNALDRRVEHVLHEAHQTACPGTRSCMVSWCHRDWGDEER